MAVKNPTPATASQKDQFLTRFEKIVRDNEKLRDNYKIQFFNTATKSNYVINGLNGKSINVMEFLTSGEIEEYKVLKSSWQN